MRDIPERWVELYLHDATVHASLQMYRLGKQTWAEAMEELAMHQAKCLHHARRQAVKMVERDSFLTTIVVPKDCD